MRIATGQIEDKVRLAESAVRRGPKPCPQRRKQIARTEAKEGWKMIGSVRDMFSGLHAGAWRLAKTFPQPRNESAMNAIVPISPGTALPAALAPDLTRAA